MLHVSISTIDNELLDIFRLFLTFLPHDAMLVRACMLYIHSLSVHRTLVLYGTVNASSRNLRRYQHATN